MQINLYQNFYANSINFGTKKQFKKMFEVCAYSGETFATKDTRTIEHIIPIIREGSNDLGNKLVVKRSWNSQRSDIPLGDFIKKYPTVRTNIIKAVKALEGKIIDGVNWAEAVKSTLQKEIGYNIFN